MKNWTASKKYLLIMMAALLMTTAIVIGYSFYNMRISYLNTFSLYNEAVLQQTTDRMTAFHDRVSGIYQAASQSIVLREYLSKTSLSQSRRALLLSSFLSSWTPMIQSGSDLGKIIFLGSNGAVLTLGDYSSKQMNAAELAEHSLNTVDRNGISYSYSDDGFFTDGIPIPAVIMSKHLSRRRNGLPYGTMFVVIPESQFAELYANAYEENSRTLVMNEDGLIISCNQKELIGVIPSEIQQASSHTAGTQSVSLSGKEYLMIISSLPALQLKLISLVDQKAILQRLYTRLPVLYGLCAVIVLISALLMYSISTRMNTEFKRLMKHMSRAESGRLIKINPVDTDPYIRSLQERFNQMTDEIDQYILRLQDEEKRQRESEIKTLQAQINPHFLYNTLASIKFLSWQNNNKAISEMVDALTLLLRSTIGTTEREETVETEIEVLKSYTCIAHYRYGESIKVEITADEGCLEAIMPRMIVQPFLENAFFHAYQKKKAGCVRVGFTHKGNQLEIMVSDDGDGMNPEDVKVLLSRETKGPHFTSMGVHNVCDRLSLIYGESAHVHVNSILGAGTTIYLSIPFQLRSSG